MERSILPRRTDPLGAEAGLEVALLLSGGVDSSVALHRLLDAGHRVTAFYLKVWLEDELAHLGGCPWEEDLQNARAVCEQVSVPLEVVPLQRAYRDRVVEEALRELRAGRTPSPDCLCNPRIKFGAFQEVVGGRFDRLASGHYARIGGAPEDPWLLAAADPVKDQTYFLALLSGEQLGRCLFPVGSLTKEEVRREARRRGLPNRERPDSQGLCFLGEVRYPDFVRAHLGTWRGEIREAASGRLLGEHPGHWFYTIGQRFGLGLGGGPWYVVEKDPERNEVRVAHGSPSYRRRFGVPSPSWIGDPPPGKELEVKVRHGPHRYRCRIEKEGAGGLAVTLGAADGGLAPGQVAVFYQEERCLGGGAIQLEERAVGVGTALRG
jgi:tRNA (5-methylaminomethyl-2-thiouridylate)-methyltransferase